VSVEAGARPVGIEAGARDRLSLVLDRVYAAVPLAFVFVCLSGLYVWQAHNHVSPWEFGDELQLTQIARGIAETGHGMRRGEPYGFHTLATVLTAPAWWIDNTATAYAVVKYIGVFTMTAAVFPAYFLARLIASRRAALFAAAAAGAIPSFAYASMILTEPLAYFWSTLCLFLVAKGLATRGRWWLGAAAVACVVAPLVRGQLAVLPAIYVLAALAVAWTGEAARRWRRRWSPREWIGAGVLLIGAIVFTNAIVSSQSQEWLIATGFWRGRIVDLGLWAAGAFTIGLGILPVVAGLSALFRPRSEPRTPELRAFASVLAASVVCFGLYAAVKAAYISTVFATRIEERNLIYLAPPLLAGTALWLDRRRLLLVPLLAAAGFACYVILATPYALENVPYDDAFGLSIVQMTNRRLSFADSGVEWLVVGTLLVSVALLVAPRLLARRPRASGGVAALAAALVLAWCLTGEITGSNASNGYSRTVLTLIPSPPNWLDRATGNTSAVYVGQGVDSGHAFLVNLVEFWNRSLKQVWTLDGTDFGPGHTITPDLAATNGELFPDPPVQYVVTDSGINFVGTPAGTFGAADRTWRVYRIEHPLRTAQSVTGLSADGWSGATAAYNQYETPGHRRGYLTVTLSRFAAYGVPAPPADVTIRLGQLVISDQHEPALGQVSAVRRWRVRTYPPSDVPQSATTRTFVLPTPRPPFRVELSVSPTFSLRDYGGSDARQLGVQPSFAFSVSKPPAGR
jgi:hypothetical protein